MLRALSVAPGRSARAEPAGAGPVQARPPRRGARHLSRDRRPRARRRGGRAATWACWRSSPSAPRRRSPSSRWRRAWRPTTSGRGATSASPTRSFGDARAAAAAFRRAGQDALADELEAAHAPPVVADAPVDVGFAAARRRRGSRRPRRRRRTGAAAASRGIGLGAAPPDAADAAAGRRGLAGLAGVVVERRDGAPVGRDARGAAGLVRAVAAGAEPRQRHRRHGEGRRAGPAVGARRGARARRRRARQRGRVVRRARGPARARAPERRAARLAGCGRSFASADRARSGSRAPPTAGRR